MAGVHPGFGLQVVKRIYVAGGHSTQDFSVLRFGSGAQVSEF